MFKGAAVRSPLSSYTAVSTEDVEASKSEEPARTARNVLDEEDGATDQEAPAKKNVFTKSLDLPVGNTSEHETTLNLTTFLFGASFLALPYALAKGGPIVLLAIIIVPLIDFYTGRILIECLYETDRLYGNKVRVHATYRDIGVASFSTAGGVLVDLVVYSSLVSNMLNILVLGGSLISLLVAMVPLSSRGFILVMAVAVFPATLMKDLAKIAWLSLVSFAAVCCTILAVTWYSLSHFQAWRTSEFLFAGTTQEVAYALALVLFCFETHTILIDAEESMADTTRMSSSLFATYAYACLLAIPFVMFSFLAFGKGTDEVIVRNLPTGLVHVVLGVFLLTGVLFCFPVGFHAIIHSLEHTVIAKNLSTKVPPLAWFLTVRIATFLSIVLISILLPYFAVLAAFFGSFSVPYTTVICPCTFHLKLKFKDSSWVQIITNLFLVFLGITVQVVSLYFSVRALFEIWVI